MSAFFIYDSGPYNFSPIRPLCRIEILTKFVSPPHCHATWCLYFSESDVFQIYAPSLFSLDKRFFKVKVFQNDIVPWGVYTYTWQEILSPYCRQNNNRVILSIYEESPKKYTSDSSGLHSSEWHTSRQGISHCSNDVYFKGGSLLSFRVRLSADEESSSYLR